jgi:hypothetical protein
MASMISSKDKDQVMLVFMASVTQVGTLSQHLSYALEVPRACDFDS